MTYRNNPSASAVVGVPAYGASTWLIRCLERLDTYTPAHIEIVVWDDGTPDSSVVSAVADISSARISYQRSAENRGFVASCNSIFQIAEKADVILVNSDVLVSSGWFESLRAAAYSGDRVATATAMTNNGTIATISMPNSLKNTLAKDDVIDSIASDLITHISPTYPDLPTGVGHCIYIRRSAIDLVGLFDESFSPGYGEEVDFSQRCISVGLNHVLADNAYVYHAGSASFDSQDLTVSRSTRIRSEHEALVRQRYPWYEDLVGDFIRRSDSLLSSAVLRAESKIGGIGVTIDGRCFNGPPTGTQVQTAYLIHALHELGQCRIRVLLPDAHSEFFTTIAGRMPGIESLRASSINSYTPKTDIVHRPYQLSTIGDLCFLHRLGHRLVINQLDFIAFNSPNYFDSPGDWLDYRMVTETALAECAQALFISSHARQEGIRLGLIDHGRSSIVYCGTDHVSGGDESEELPGGIREPYVLCLGTDFAHKNRAFAIRVLGAMRSVHGWEGQLVLAGPHAAAGNGSSAERDAALSIGDDASYVVDLGSVTDKVRSTLLGKASCVICPSTYEGFGLVPFEAAAHGTPCVYSGRTSHAEMLPDVGNTIPEWDPVSTGRLLLEVISNDDLSRRIVHHIQLSASARTWTDTAERTLDAYNRALQATPCTGGTVRRLRESSDSQLAIREQAMDNMHKALDSTHKDFADLERHLKESEPSIAFAHAIPGPFHGSLEFAAQHKALRVIMLWPIRAIFALGCRFGRA